MEELIRITISSMTKISKNILITLTLKTFNKKINKGRLICLKCDRTNNFAYEYNVKRE